MATGRTLAKWMRVYIDGFDFSGDARTLGPLLWTFEEEEFTPLTAATKGYLSGQGNIGVGTLNALLDNTAVTGIHTVLNTPGVMRTVMAPLGIRAAPAQGDPCYVGQFEQKDYAVEGTDGAVALTINFEPSERASSLVYARPWGSLMHAKGAETGANTAVGIDDSPAGAATTKGGYMVYSIFASNAVGTVVVKMQDAAVNNDGSFADIGSCATSAIGFAAIAAGTAHGLVAIGATATVRQFTRWQIVLAGGMTTVTFALAFVRGNV